MINKKAQLTIFIIIAIAIVTAIIILVWVMGDPAIDTGLPRDLVPVYTYFLSCVEDETKQASVQMGTQAGHLELPEFKPGSQYMPFSSQLDFLGIGVPYWYYISNNKLSNEQVPTEKSMESQLASYLEERLKDCDFREFEDQGFIVDKQDPEVQVDIRERKINVEVEMPLTIVYGEVVGDLGKHEVEVDSSLGKLYNTAKRIYDKEQDSLFLENYGVDILRLYAPVDGTEITCSPQVWEVDEIKEDLTAALQANTPSIKVKGDYYSGGDKYFIQDLGENVNDLEGVNFLYLDNFPTKIEIYPDEDPLMAEPVGLQEGLGVLGFCYVPYHFVYDLAYPVLVQVYDGDEIFQFPVAVVIDKNKPREALDSESTLQAIPELCTDNRRITEMTVYTYDSNLDPIEAQIKYKCFDTSCMIGETKISGNDALLTGMFPQCVNGFVIASKEGYSTKKHIASTVETGNIDVILEKQYTIDLEVEKGGRTLSNSYAIVSFVGEESRTVLYPEQTELTLSTGEYEVQVYVYSNSSIYLEGSSSEKCVDVPKSGLGALFGATDEKCFTMEIPSQTVDSAVSGGGKQTYYLSESELAGSEKLIVSVEDFGVPNKVEDLQINYNNVEINGLDLRFE